MGIGRRRFGPVALSMALVALYPGATGASPGATGASPGATGASPGATGAATGAAGAATLEWGRARAIDSLPADAPSGASAGLDALACPSPGSCVAVGAFGRTFHTEPATGFSEAVTLKESGGVWGHASEVTLPANASAGNEQAAGLDSIACPASGSCVAVGSSENTSGNGQPIAVGESGGVWGQAREVMLPAHVKGAEGNQLTSVACPASGSCVAVGFYEEGSANFNPPSSHALAVDESGGVWGRARGVTMPSKLGHATGDRLESVACRTSGSCVAVGDYEDSSGDTHPLAVSESGHTWSGGREIALPSNGAGGATPGLQSVACPASRSCVAVGQYESHGGGQLPMAVGGSGRAWGRASEIALPREDGSGASVLENLDSVACPTSRSCVALGGEIVVSTVARG